MRAFFFKYITITYMFDLKVINSVIEQLEQDRGIPKEKVIKAIEDALATAYKKEYGKKGQIINARFDPDSGTTSFEQVKIVVDNSIVKLSEEEDQDESDERVRFNPEHHIMIEDARLIKAGVELEEEIIFPLENRDDYGRISAQTAKQVIIQKIREAEKSSVYTEYEDKQGEIISGTVQRVERGNIFVDLGRATGILPYEEQIPGERFRQGERIRALLYSVEETPRGIFLRLSRSRPEFLAKLFEVEAPEVANGIVEIKSIAREAGSRSKMAVFSNDEYIDPVGSCVGQRGVRVSTVMSEIGNEKIDIVEYSENPQHFVEEAISPARALSVEVDEANRVATVHVTPDQQSLAIGKGGQNARLAAKLTGYKIDIKSADVTEEGEEFYDDDYSDEEDYTEDEGTLSEEQDVETLDEGENLNDEEQAPDSVEIAREQGNLSPADDTQNFDADNPMSENEENR
jgi:transcription termination/antitermination protein NusA